MHRLSMVKEDGSVKGKKEIYEFISEVRRELRNFSTIGGLKDMAQFSFLNIKDSQKKQTK